MKNREIVECSCNACKQMCKNSPCFPTPSDAIKLIEAGFKDKLMLSIWMSFKFGIYFVIAPVLESSGCIFLTSNGLCSIHDRGLKPTEGKLAIHDLADDSLRESICKTWATEEGIQLIKEHFFDQSVLDHLINLKQLLD